MCLAVPMLIESVEADMAVAESRGVRRRVSLQLLAGAGPGDYVLVHAGFAIQKLDAAAAQETLRLLADVERR